DENGRVLYRLSGSRSTSTSLDAGVPSSARHSSTPTQTAAELLRNRGSSPRLCTENARPGSERCAWMRLVFSDSTDIHWLGFSTASQCGDTQILAICELLGKLLIREHDVMLGMARSYETIREQE